ncbi:ATP-dependent zinc metalloprotease FtsH [Koleobacter methoxysyntrophicus]|uniref:ATP-dependent zinc metalloprotease FtsH n=1 Tax=Koleobacter methoxysyntrophicus TaxID=2751313 RepID=A0A8A0RLG5_9FIRM|nr:ATP-dependent zinc metalloprotease FtsH [Koleobacter methoxysyntrophicus]QSQ08460.1 ATP-dependent zinc metalloprotease FtsH [Koleobacter methoxysyntrophicus]
MNKFFRNISFYLLIVILILSLVQWYSTRDNDIAKIDYTQLIKAVNSNQISEIVIVNKNITGKMKDGRKFTSYIPDVGLFLTKINDKIEAGEIKVETQPPPEPPWWAQILPSIFLVLLFVGAWFFFMQQSQGGGSRVMSFGKSRAKLHTDDRKRVTFKDVAGVDEAKEELEEVVEFLKHPKKFVELGARIPKGVLLVGPPGTGKTLLARAVAGEAGVPFFSISGSDFVEMFVGVGASRVRDLFEQAKKNSPCIVFIDEIDAVGRQRGAGLGGGHDEREQTLNQLLVEMDGFGINEGIIIIAATNRPDILDPALLRPGRFDRQVVVDRPDVKGREEILKVHARGKPLEENIDLGVLARRTPGFTGADLENLINEAALLAARRNKKKIQMLELEEAITRVIAGPEKKSRVMSERERRLVAYHEAGHAVVAQLLPNVDPVHEVSIVPRGRAGGYTMILPKEDRFFMAKSELLEQITHLLGGRVSEALVLHEISTGAQNDLERATEIARRMIMEFGMSEKLGSLTFGNKHDEVFLGRDLARHRNYSEEVAAAIDKEVREIIDTCYKRAETLLKENIRKLHKVAEVLLEKEKLDAKQFQEVFASA